MSKTLDEVIESLPLELQVAAEARGRELIREEMTLQALRKQLELTQESMAERLDIRQGNISKVENRSDMLISTLRSYVEALGGSLERVARMPGRPPVTVDGFTDSATSSK